METLKGGGVYFIIHVFYCIFMHESTLLRMTSNINTIESIRIPIPVRVAQTVER